MKIYHVGFDFICLITTTQIKFMVWIGFLTHKEKFLLELTPIYIYIYM